jgi:SAM-dependent methyltransferase
MDRSVASDTRAAYDDLAHVYDGLTAHHDHESWLARLLDVAQAHGLAGRRSLDVGCGTGKSFMPLVRRGFDVTACDISPRMAARARRRARGHGVIVHVADMRRLPQLCEACDLVTCLDDAVNYLLDADELRAGLCGMRRNLRPGGLLLFDVNTLATYRSVFCEGLSWTSGADTYDSLGEPRAVAAGSLFATTLRARRGDLVLAQSRHVQRHHPVPALEQALGAVGLEPLAVYGSGLDGRPVRPPDEGRHTKLVVVARRPPVSPSKRERR